MTAISSPEELDVQLSRPMATLQGASDRIMELLVALRQGIDRTQVEQAGLLTPEGLRQALDGLQQDALRQIDALEQACQQARTQIEATLASITNRPTDPARQLVDLFQHEQSWRRLKDTLDKVPDVDLLLRVQAEVDDAEAEGDTLRLRVLNDELPTYLQSRGRPMPSAFTEKLDEAILSHATPVERRAEAIRRELGEGWARLTAAIQMARKSVTGQSSLPPGILPGWQTGSAIRPPMQLPRVTIS